MRYLKVLAFNLLIVGFEVMMLISLIAVFYHWWSPAASVLSVVICGVAVGLLLVARRKWHMYRPSLSRTTWVVLGIVVLSAIAGIQPLASLRDGVVDTVTDWFQRVPAIEFTESRDIVGKWQRVVDNRVSIMSPTIEFLRDGTVIIDDGRDVLVGTYKKLTDEYVKISMETSFFGYPITSMDTIKYQISGNRLTVRVEGHVTIYQRADS